MRWTDHNGRDLIHPRDYTDCAALDCDSMSVTESQAPSQPLSHPQSHFCICKPLIPLTKLNTYDPCTGPGIVSGKKPGATRPFQGRQRRGPAAALRPGLGARLSLVTATAHRAPLARRSPGSRRARGPEGTLPRCGAGEPSGVDAGIVTCCALVDPFSVDAERSSLKWIGQESFASSIRSSWPSRSSSACWRSCSVEGGGVSGVTTLGIGTPAPLAATPTSEVGTARWMVREVLLLIFCRLEDEASAGSAAAPARLRNRPMLRWSMNVPRCGVPCSPTPPAGWARRLPP